MACVFIRACTCLSLKHVMACGGLQGVCWHFIIHVTAVAIENTLTQGSQKKKTYLWHSHAFCWLFLKTSPITLWFWLKAFITNSIHPFIYKVANICNHNSAILCSRDYAWKVLLIPVRIFSERLCARYVNCCVTSLKRVFICILRSQMCHWGQRSNSHTWNEIFKRDI